MKRFDLWKLSLLNVFSSPVRSILTVLGFAIGVAAILAVLTLGDAGRRQVESEMSRLGIDRVWLTPSQEQPIKRGDGEWLSETTGLQTEELVYLPGKVQGMQAAAAGCSRAFLSELTMEDGRLPLPLEWTREGCGAVMGVGLAEQLKVQAGDWVDAFHRVFRVCGLVRLEGVSSVDMENALIVPIDVLCELTSGVISEIQLRYPEDVSLEKAEQMALSALARTETPVQAVSMRVQMEAASSVIDTFVNVLKWVALVCILVGGIGVMNILFISVRERRREIGVMKSLGTTPAQICMLFLLEAAVYAVIGGIVGLMLGFGLIQAAGRSIQLSASATVPQCASVFAAALAVGVLFGVLPAMRASALKCADALRQE